MDDKNWGLISDATEKTQLPIISSTIKKIKKVYSNEISVSQCVNDKIDYCIKSIISSQNQPNQRLLSLEKIIDNYSNILDENAISKYKEILNKYQINGGKIVKGDIYPDHSKDLEEELCNISLFNGEFLNVHIFSYLVYLEYLIYI